jgi:crossover junction endodeoxyribonuclease RuvC
VKTIYFGIDPGAKGGIAAIWGDKPTNAIPMPYGDGEYDVQAICKYLDYDKDEVRCMCVMEKVHSMPKQGVASTFAFGKGFGILIGILGALEIPAMLVPPQAWKKVMLAGEDKSDKGSSIRVARRLFPGVSLKASSKCRTDHDGMAEALLLAEYARRICK